MFSIIHSRSNRAFGIATAMVLAIMSIRDARTEERSTNVVVDLTPGCAKTGSVFVDESYMVGVAPARMTIEIIPAVYKDDENGKKICVQPEKTVKHVIPAVYETRTRKVNTKLIFEANAVTEDDLESKFKELSARSARVEISGVSSGDGFKVTAIVEKK